MIDGAWEAGGLAVLWTGERERKLLYRHTNTTDGKLERIPQAVVAREDGLRLERAALANPGKLRVRLKMTNQIGGPLGPQDVCGGNRRDEKPDEKLVLGATLEFFERWRGAPA